MSIRFFISKSSVVSKRISHGRAWLPNLPFFSKASCLVWAGLSLAAVVVHAQSSEIERLKGYAEHEIENRQFERERLKGEKEFNEEQEIAERERQQDTVEYRKRQAKIEQSNHGQDYKADLVERQAWMDDYEKDRKAYAKEQSKFDRKKFPNLVTEAEELNLDSKRPRYALKARPIYGAPLKLGKSVLKGGTEAGGSGRTSGFSAGSPNGVSNGSPSFPPPPQFDDFGDGGFVPSVGMGEGFNDDIPPPPPPPPMPFDNGGGIDEGFPPPPPPAFDEGFGGF